MNLADDFKARNEAFNKRMTKSGSMNSVSIGSKKDKRPASPTTARSGRNFGPSFKNEEIQVNQVVTASGRSIQGGGSNQVLRRRAPSAAASEAGSELAALLNVTRGDTSLSNSASLRFDFSDNPQNGKANLNNPARPIASSTPSPSALLLPYGLLSTSMTFFLFGFQTHEKSILIPLLPLTLLMGAKGDDWGGGANEVDWEWAVLGNNVAVFR